MNSAEGLKDEKTSIFNKVLQTSNQEKVIHKNLEDKKKPRFLFLLVSQSSLISTQKIGTKIHYGF